jgi:hypothetical protein
MSVRGHSRRFGYVPVTSGLLPTPDMALRNNRRYVPIDDIELLLAI